MSGRPGLRTQLWLAWDSFEDDKSVRELNSGGGGTTVWLCEKPLNRTLQKDAFYHMEIMP